MLASMESAPNPRPARSRRPASSSSPNLVMTVVPPVGFAEVRWPSWLAPVGASWKRTGATNATHDPRSE